MELYKHALKAIEAELGKGETSDADLNRLGRILFGKQWAAAVPANVVCPVSSARPYGITNTKGAPGEHWMGVVWEAPKRRMVFDSFGRRVLRISADPKILAHGGRIDNTAAIDTQPILASDCGQRSMAWLVVYALRGADAARAI